MNVAAYTLKPPSSVLATVTGSFTGNKTRQEIAAIRGTTTLEISMLDEEGHLIPLVSQPTFSNLRSLAMIRPVGGSKDLLIVGSDSGVVCLIEYVESSEDMKHPHLRRVAELKVGQWGCRRQVPGQYVAADPAGRAIFAASVDGHKTAAVVIRDAATGKIELRETTGWAKVKGDATVYSAVALDMGADRPAFAVLAGRDDDALQNKEAEKEAAGLEIPDDSLKHVTIYEIDLTTNEVVYDQKWRIPASRTGNALMAIPGRAFGNTGAVLVLSENWIGLKHRDFKELRAPFPRPKGLLPAQGVLPIAWSGVGPSTEKGGGWTALIQSEWGDLYEVKVKHASPTPTLIVRVIDWLTPCTTLTVLTAGKGKVLWAGAETGDHVVYVLGDSGSTCSSSSSSIKRGGGGNDAGKEAGPLREGRVGDDSEEAAKVAPVFERVTSLGRGKRFLTEASREPSLAGVTHLVAGQGQGPGRLIALCGRSGASSIRVLESGLPVVEELQAPLSFLPTGIWTVVDHKRKQSYLLLSLPTRTLVLEVKEAITEVADRGFHVESKTIEAGVLEDRDHSIVQVVPHMLRRIKPGQATHMEWRPPGRREIDKGAIAGRYVVVAVGGVEVMCFEAAVGQGSEELAIRDQKDVGADVSALHIKPGDRSTQRPTLVFVGTMDLTLRILAYTLQGTIIEKVKINLTHRPVSLATYLPTAAAAEEGSNSLLLVGLTSGEMVIMKYGVEVGTSVSATGGGAAAAPAAMTLKVERKRHVGTNVIATGAAAAAAMTLEVERKRHLGNTAVKLIPLQAGRQPAVLALTAPTAWLFYTYRGRTYEHPLAYEAFDDATPIAMDKLPEALVTIRHQSLSIVWIERLGVGFTEDVYDLGRTPRGYAPLPNSHVMVMIEGDPKPTGLAWPTLEEEEGEEAMEVDEQEHAIVRGVAGSAIRVMEPSTGRTRQRIEMEEGRVAISVEVLRFRCAPGGELFVVVGVVPTPAWVARWKADKATTPARPFEINSNPPGGWIYTYRVLANGLRLGHITELEEGLPPRVLKAFKDEEKLLVGLGHRVRVYDLGKKRLLKKCEFSNLNSTSSVIRLEHEGSWIFVTDVLKGVKVLVYRTDENVLQLVVDDPIPRLMVDSKLIDRTNIAGSDKLGNVFILQMPWETAVEEAADGPISRHAFWEACGEEGAPGKFDDKIEYHVGEVITSLTKASLGAKADRQTILYATITGAIGVLSPLGSPKDLEVLTALEAALKKDHPILFPTYRDHLTYRSAFRPSRGVVDLDLIVQAGPIRRATAAKEAKLDAKEVEAVVTEALTTMHLARSI